MVDSRGPVGIDKPKSGAPGRVLRSLFDALLGIRRNSEYYYGRGWRGILKYIRYGVLRTNTFRVFEIDLREPLSRVEFEGGVEPRIPSAAELDELRSGKTLPREFFCDKTHGVNMCFVAVRDGELAYIHWAFFKGHRSRFLRLGDGTAEFNYGTTLPAHRGTGLAGRMLAFGAWHLRTIGYRKVVGVCHEENPPIMKALRQAGFSEVARIVAIGPFNRKINA
jgi:hypothetical protein